MRCIAVMLVLALAGCANHRWAAGPNVNPTLTFEQQEAQCRYMARHGGTAMVAAGSPAFVAGAGLGHGIGNGIRAGQDFNDCMQAAGYVRSKN